MTSASKVLVTYARDGRTGFREAYAPLMDEEGNGQLTTTMTSTSATFALLSLPSTR